MNDQVLIEHIMAGGKWMETGLSIFYQQNLKYVKIMGKKYGLSKEKLLDAYSDSVIDFRDQVINKRFQQKSKCSTYLYRIFQNKCIDILRKKTTKLIGGDIPEHILDNNEDIVQKLTFRVRKEYLLKLMDQLSGKCRDILLDWNEGYTMDEIASRNGLLNDHVARSRRYSCLKRLVALVSNSQILAESEGYLPRSERWKTK